MVDPKKVQEKLNAAGEVVEEVVDVLSEGAVELLGDAVVAVGEVAGEVLSHLGD